MLVFSALRFDGPARGYWDTYVTVPAMFMTGQRVELVRLDGTPRFDYELKGRVPDDTYDPTPGSFGISSEDRRFGEAVLFGAPFAVFRMAAFRWGFAAAWAGLFFFGFLCMRRLVGGLAVPLGGALVLVLNPFSLYLERLNGNLFAAAVLALLFFLLLEERPRGWLVGLIYGVLGGIRPEAVVLAPIVLAFLVRGGHGRRLGRLAGFLVAGILGILPVLAWNDYAYGSPFVHPSQVAHLEGFRPVFVHSLLGKVFLFNGLLNYPFHHHVVRTPHFAYPTFLLWPLVTVKVLGVVLAALAPFGIAWLLRHRRFVAVALLYWYLIVYLLFMFQENWEELKQTFMALHLFPLAVFVAAGARWVADEWRSVRRWAAVAGVAGLLAGAVFAARLVRVPADERWYVRFPHAAVNESGLGELPEERRKDWHYFYTAEVPSEVERERLHLGTPAPWPALYRPVHWPDASVLRTMAAEPHQKELRTLAIWSYIYE